MPHLFSSNLSILFFQLPTGLEFYSLYARVISANQGFRFSQPDLMCRLLLNIQLWQLIKFFITSQKLTALIKTQHKFVFKVIPYRDKVNSLFCQPWLVHIGKKLSPQPQVDLRLPAGK